MKRAPSTLAPVENVVTTYSRSQLSDEVLLRQLKASFARERFHTAALLADLAEVDARKLYRSAGYPHMSAYCMDEFGLPKDAAYKRIQAARTAREFPVMFELLADGRLNLSGVCLLAPHLTDANAAELLDEASGKKKAEIEVLLARRFPRSEAMPLVEVVAGASGSLAPGQVEMGSPEDDQPSAGPLAPGQVALRRSKSEPIADQRYSVQFTMSQSTHEKLQYAQSLLSHRIPSGDLSAVLDRVLDLAISRLEKQKFAATDKPRSAARVSSNQRHIPAHARRAVWQRDGGRCTFVSAKGHRCEARDHLEYDHVVPVARGGRATIDNLRLRCRAHNQYAAEREFGDAFMDRKRRAARSAAGEREAEERKKERTSERMGQVVHCLRQLGYRPDQARRAAEFSDSLCQASLEDRVKRALSYFAPRVVSRSGAFSQPANCDA